MKTEQLKELGLTDDQIKAVMAENGKDVTAEKGKYETLKTDYEAAKEQLTTANKTIDGFKDYEQVKGQVAEYKTKFEQSETKADQIRADYEFNGKLSDAAKKHGAKNVKAVIPFLKVDDLKTSKNQEAEIEAAFAALKAAEDTSFIFGTTEPINNPVLGTNGGKVLTGDDGALRKAMGLEPEKK